MRPAALTITRRAGGGGWLVGWWVGVGGWSVGGGGFEPPYAVPAILQVGQARSAWVALHRSRQCFRWSSQAHRRLAHTWSNAVSDGNWRHGVGTSRSDRSRNTRCYGLSRAASRVLISAIVAEADATESASSFLSSSRSSVDMDTITCSPPSTGRGRCCSAVHETPTEVPPPHPANRAPAVSRVSATESRMTNDVRHHAFERRPNRTTPAIARRTHRSGRATRCRSAPLYPHQGLPRPFATCGRHLQSEPSMRSHHRPRRIRCHPRTCGCLVRRHSPKAHCRACHPERSEPLSPRTRLRRWSCTPP
jgi:hypothetical protein